MTDIYPRVRRRTSKTLEWIPVDADGEPTTDDPGVVTVTITRADGSTVVADAATASVGVKRTFTLTRAHTADLDRLTVRWSDATGVLDETFVDIVGGYYFTADELRESQPSKTDETKFPTPRVVHYRTIVETMIEDLTSVAWVPRFSVDTFLGVNTARMRLASPEVRDVRFVRAWWGDGDPVDLTATELGYIRRDGAWLVLPYALTATRVQVGYEHGYDHPLPDVKEQAMVAVSHAIGGRTSAIPSSATYMELAGGGRVTLAVPGQGRWHFGIPSVDDMVARRNHGGGALVAV